MPEKASNSKLSSVNTPPIDVGYEIGSEGWVVEDSADLYALHDWGVNYFGVSEQGDVLAKSNVNGEAAAVPIIDIIRGMNERGMQMPAVLRIENLLDDRVKELNEAFSSAIKANNYQNHYRGVFPIKVNQQCHVIEEIADFGSRYHHGFEVGSKAELIIALSEQRDNESLIICNGYKDSEFIELGLLAREMGIQCIFVLETISELTIILERSKSLNIAPVLGVRIRSTVVVDGHWNEDSGDRSIFGLSTSDLLDVVEQLKQSDMLHCLQLLHCHLGSQIPNIRNIRNGVLEACRYYAGLKEEGAPMGFLDLGGGLAVDYEGKRANSTHSKNYRLDEYCHDIVETVCESLDSQGIAHPVLITESGRATAAYSSMLLFNILNIREHVPQNLPHELPEDSHELLVNLWETKLGLSKTNYQECYNDTLYYRDEIRELFRRGQVDLKTRAFADNLALAVFESIADLVKEDKHISGELENLPELLATIYYGNFSLFQSLPDVWAIDQVFPVMPIHRLNERPTQEAVIADLTCDCDGKIDRFSGKYGIKHTLPLHALKEGEEYYLGVFLVGAYQETLGDLHNLFGDTNVVSVKINEDSSFDFQREFHGDSISDVLSYVEYDTKKMTEQFRKRAENSVKKGDISASRRKQLMRAFTESLNGYTYFEKEEL